MKVHRHLDDELEDCATRCCGLAASLRPRCGGRCTRSTERDPVAAREVLEHDDVVDELEVEIDRQCIDIFVLRQPAARDLRFVMSVAKMAPVLERIADHACNIARTAIDLNNEPEVKNAHRIAQMGEIASSMLARRSTRLPNPTPPLRARSFSEMPRSTISTTKSFSELIGMMVTAPNTATRERALAVRRQAPGTNRRLRH